MAKMKQTDNNKSREECRKPRTLSYIALGNTKWYYRDEGKAFTLASEGLLE
jgi:hypothetical protein